MADTRITLFKRPLLAGALAAAATAAAPTAAQAASDIFLRLDGIQGESVDAKHKSEIDVLSFSLGFVNQLAGGTGGGGGAGKVSCGDVNLVKNIDRSSPSLISSVMTGKHIKSGVLTFTTGGAGGPTYYTLAMTDVIATSIVQSDSAGGPKITEQLTLNASAFSFRYRPQNPNGSLGATVRFDFDCKANKAG